MKKADLISKVLERIPEYTELEVSQVLEALDEIGVLNTSFDAASNGLLNERAELMRKLRISELEDQIEKLNSMRAVDFSIGAAQFHEVEQQRDIARIENEHLKSEMGRANAFYSTQLRLLEEEREMTTAMCEKLGTALEKSAALTEQTHSAARAFIVSGDLMGLTYWDKKRPSAEDMRGIRQVVAEWNVLKSRGVK